MNTLKDKCRLTPEEITKFETIGQYTVGDVGAEITVEESVWDINNLLVAQLDKAIPIIRQEERERIAQFVENLPTDGWDKWHFYNQDLAKKIREANNE